MAKRTDRLDCNLIGQPHLRDFHAMEAKGRASAGALTWLRKRAMSFVYASRGFLLLWHTQPNFRIHIAASLCAVAFGLLFRIPAAEWLILVITITIVLTVEGVNTAIEKMVDLCQPDRHPLARDVKDLSAAAVLLASTGALIVGVILFGPRFVRLLWG
jgi:diacylglycerol kinase